MNKRFAQFALPVLFFAFTGAAQAEEVSFGPGTFFTGDAWEVLYVNAGATPYDVGGFKSVADATSNYTIATNRYEVTPATFVSTGGEFNLDGLWVAGGWGSLTLTITGYLNGAEIYSDSIYVTTTAAEYTFTGFMGIDSFSIATGNDFNPDTSLPRTGAYWALGSASITAVPEPETYAMLLAGLALVGAIARRRRAV